MTTRASLAAARNRMAEAARAIQPILNRVVMVGPPVVDLLLNDPAVRTPSLVFAADSTLQLLSTSMIDRLALDLNKLGCARSGRTATSDRWQIAPGLEVELIQVRTGIDDSPQAWLEYATLLTLPFAVDDGLSVRVASAPAVLALECAGFRVRGGSPLDSEEVERMVLLIAARIEIERECAAAPAELRSFVATELARILEHDALHLVLQRALMDAVRLPSLAARVGERIRRIAAMSAA
jgi:hypothetical protein